MSTPAQIAANQANSKFSTGATTDAGKQTVSKNSLKHGLSSPNPVHVILPGEEDPFAEHLEGYVQAYAPIGVPEQDLVRSLASNNWRLQRCHSMERALFSYLQKEVAEGAETAAETLRELNRTVGYAHKIERAIEKTRNELKSHAVRAQSRLLQSPGRSHPADATRACQRPTARSSQGIPIPRALRWLCLLPARSRASHRPRRPLGRGQVRFIVA